MQINFRLLPVLTLAVFATFTACKKEDSKPADPTNEIETHTDDQSRVSTQIDAVSNDAVAFLETSATFSGGRGQNALDVSCDATATFDSTSNPRTITITYSGTSCNGSFKRTGSVVVSMAANTHWKDAGASITINYQNLKITRTADNKSITINGTHTLTNVSGGLLINLPNLQSVTHTIEGEVSIKFDDNSQRTWHVARKHVFTYDNGIVVAITGNHTDGNNTGITEWGSNRFGNAFTTSITEPLVIRQDCSFRLTSGQVKHEGFGTATATFGLDVNGNPTACPGTGHYYYKLVWTGPNGASASIILPY